MSCFKLGRTLLLAMALACLAGCSDPQVYGSVGISSGYGGYGGYGYHGGYSPRVQTSISIGGRIH
jgi:hypothetical protein